MESGLLRERLGEQSLMTRPFNEANSGLSKYDTLSDPCNLERMPECQAELASSPSLLFSLTGEKTKQKKLLNSLKDSFQKVSLGEFEIPSFHLTCI